MSLLFTSIYSLTSTLPIGCPVSSDTLPQMVPQGNSLTAIFPINTGHSSVDHFAQTGYVPGARSVYVTEPIVSETAGLYEVPPFRLNMIPVAKRLFVNVIVTVPSLSPQDAGVDESVAVGQS